MSTPCRILVAGIGNIFHGDDAFGVEVVSELSKSELPEDVEAADFGIRGYDLAYAIMEGYEAVILVDATARGNAPGTLYLIELDTEGLTKLETELPDGHTLDPVHVLQLVQSLGGHTERLYLVGCEPGVLETEDGQIGLSESVQDAVPRAVEMIRTLLRELSSKNEVQQLRSKTERQN